jgi:hypothetical protein
MEQPRRGRARRAIVTGAIAVALGLLATASAGPPGCSNGDRAAGDGGPADLPRCAQLESTIAAALAVRGHCDTDSDCGLIGGQNGQQTCNCAPAVLDCGGVAIENDAPGLARARDLIRQFFAAGCGGSTCDCAPSGPLHCAADHHCTAALRSCLQPPPDGGTDGSIDSIDAVRATGE